MTTVLKKKKKQLSKRKGGARFVDQRSSTKKNFSNEVDDPFKLWYVVFAVVLTYGVTTRVYSTAKTRAHLYKARLGDENMKWPIVVRVV